MLSIRIPKFRSEHFFGLSLIIFWSQNILFSYFRGFLLRIPYVKYAADYAFPVIMAITIMLSFFYIIQLLSWKDVVCVLLVSLIYLVQIVLYPENGAHLWSIAGSFFTSVLPIYFIGVCFDSEKNLRLLYLTSLVNVWAFVIFYLPTGSAGLGDQAEYASFLSRAYALLPQLLMVVGYWFKKPGVINIATGIVGFAFLLMCGNRGSVVLFLLFIAAGVLFLTEKKRGLVSAVVLAVCALIAYFFEYLVMVLNVWFTQLGMSTRIFERLLSGDFLQSAGRDVITEELWTAIWEKPVFGHGLAADRTMVSSYAHNLAIEIWISFGVFLGSLLLILICFVMIRGWLASKTRESRIVFLVLLSVGFLKLFLSSSYLQEGMFFMLLGICVGQARKARGDVLIQRGMEYESM